MKKRSAQDPLDRLVSAARSDGPRNSDFTRWAALSAAASVASATSQASAASQVAAVAKGTAASAQAAGALASSGGLFKLGSVVAIAVSLGGGGAVFYAVSPASVAESRTPESTALEGRDALVPPRPAAPDQPRDPSSSDKKQDLRNDASASPGSARAKLEPELGEGHLWSPARNAEATALKEKPAQRSLVVDERMERVHAESLLIESARRALAADPAGALVLTRRHHGEFSDGALVIERRVIAIEALVRLGSDRDARRALELFEADYPTSLHLPHLKRIVPSTSVSDK